MQITPLKTADTRPWYKATHTLPNGAQALGFGTTHENAIADCNRDIALITRLQRSQRVLRQNSDMSSTIIS